MSILDARQIPVPRIAPPAHLNVAGALAWFLDLREATTSRVILGRYVRETGDRWPHAVMPGALPADRITAAEIAWRDRFVAWFDEHFPITDPELCIPAREIAR